MLYVCYAGTFFWFTWLQRQRVQPPKFTTTNCGAYLSVQTVVFCCQREGRRNLVRFQHRTLGGALSGRSESCPRSVSVHVWVGEKPVHTPSAPSVIGFSVSSHTYTFLALIRHICPGRLARVSDSRLRIRKRHSTKPCGVSLNGCPSGQSLKRIRPPGGGGGCVSFSINLAAVVSMETMRESCGAAATHGVFGGREAKSESNGAAVDGRDGWGMCDCGDRLFWTVSLEPHGEVVV